MNTNTYVKIIYFDNEQQKILKGTLIAEDEFSLTIKTLDNIICIGKRALVRCNIILEGE